MGRYVIEDEPAKPASKRYVIEDTPVEKPNQFSLNADRVSAVGQGIKDAGGALVRSGTGVASNLLRPFEALIPGGNDFDSGHKQRIDRVEGRLRTKGYNPDSAVFQGVKLAGDVAITAPVGGALSKLVPLVSKAPAAVKFANTLKSGGFSTGAPQAATRLGKAADMGIRSAGGAVTGGAMTALVDPENAGTGALIGGALPPGVKIVGKAGGAVKRAISGPVVEEPVRKAVEAARQAGYVIPPSQAKPTLLNRTLEGLSGKITTAQNASARNQQVTNNLIAKELGLPPGAPVSLDALKNLRTQAGNAYNAVSSTGVINTTPAYATALDDIVKPAKLAAAGFPNAKPNPIIEEIESLKSTQFDASSAVAKISELRSSADTAYAAGNKELGKAYKKAASALEDAIDTHLTAIGAPADLLSGFRDARKLIAKTYSVEKAMNTTSGNVDAVKLGKQLEKGKPLSGGIRDVAAFGNQFPKAAQTVERMGSLPQTSPLDWAASGMATAATQNPAMMAGLLLRPAARKAVLSNTVQNRLSNPQTESALLGLLNDPVMQQLFLKPLPVVNAQ